MARGCCCASCSIWRHADRLSSPRSCHVANKRDSTAIVCDPAAERVPPLILRAITRERMLHEGKEFALEWEQTFAECILGQRRLEIRGGKGGDFFLKLHPRLCPHFCVQVRKGTRPVIKLAHSLCPLLHAGQRRLLGEGVDIAEKMHPTPLVQTVMGIVAAVEIRNHDARILRSQHVGHDRTGTGLRGSEETQGGRGETPQLPVRCVLTPPRLVAMNLLTRLQWGLEGSVSGLTECGNRCKHPGHFPDTDFEAADSRQQGSNPPHRKASDLTQIRRQSMNLLSEAALPDSHLREVRNGNTPFPAHAAGASGENVVNDAHRDLGEFNDLAATVLASAR